MYPITWETVFCSSFDSELTQQNCWYFTNVTIKSLIWGCVLSLLHIVTAQDIEILRTWLCNEFWVLQEQLLMKTLKAWGVNQWFIYQRTNPLSVFNTVHKLYLWIVGQTIFTGLWLDALCEVPAQLTPQTHTVSRVPSQNVTHVTRSVPYDTWAFITKTSRCQLWCRIKMQDQ